MAFISDFEVETIVRNRQGSFWSEMQGECQRISKEVTRIVDNPK